MVSATRQSLKRRMMHFLSRQKSPFSRFKIIGQGDPPDSGAMERGQTDSIDPVKHPLDLVVASFPQSNLRLSRPEYFKFGRQSRDAFRPKVKTLLKSQDGFFRNVPIRFDEVDLFNFPTG